MSGLWIFLHVVIYLQFAQDTLKLESCTFGPAIFRAIAGTDGTGTLQETVRIVGNGTTIVDARGGETVTWSEQQCECAPHAEPDDPNPAGASFLLCKECSSSFDVSDEFPLASGSISDNRNDASNLASRAKQIGS